MLNLLLTVALAEEKLSAGAALKFMAALVVVAAAVA
jgi:hypothetical protein